MPDERALRKLAHSLEAAGLPRHMIVEDDAPYAGQAMAIGLAPGDRRALRPHLRHLPLLR